MLSEKFTYLLEYYLSSGIFLIGLPVFIIMLAVILFSKDARLTVYLFLLAVTFVLSDNTLVATMCYVLRWFLLILLVIRVFIMARGRMHVSVSGVLFLIWCAITFGSVFRAPSLSRAAAFAIIQLLCFFAFFILAAVDIDSEASVKRWLNMFVLLALTVAAIGGGGYILNMGFSTGYGRLQSIFMNASTFAKTMQFPAVLLLWYGLVLEKKPTLKIICWFISGFCMFLILLSGTRGSLVAVAIVAVVLAFHYRAKMTILIVPAFILAGVIIIPRAMESQTENFRRHLLSTEAPGRVDMRKLAFDRIKERPISGWGIGAVSDSGSTVCPLSSFHNSYLDYAVELGIPGFLVVISLFMYTYLRVARLALFSARTKYIKGVSWFILANLTSMYAHALVEGFMASRGYFYFYWLLFLIALVDRLVYINSQVGLAGDYEDYEGYEGYEDYEDQQLSFDYYKEPLESI